MDAVYLNKFHIITLHHVCSATCSVKSSPVSSMFVCIHKKAVSKLCIVKISLFGLLAKIEFLKSCNKIQRVFPSIQCDQSSSRIFGVIDMKWIRLLPFGQKSASCRYRKMIISTSPPPNPRLPLALRYMVSSVCCRLL